MTDNTIETTNVQTENFICPNCGGTLRHNVHKDRFLCVSCNYEGKIHNGDNVVEEFDFGGYTDLEAKSEAFLGLAVSNCKNCGFQITFEEHEVATTCPMCNSTQFSMVKQKAGIPPEGIIPFKIDKQEAKQKFREWVKGLWFAPDKLKKSYQEGTLTGRFVPFWTFDANAFATYTGEGGSYRKVKDGDGKEHTETDWFRTNGVIQKRFDDILVIASTGAGAQDTELVGPYDTINELRPYAPEYLSGYQAEIYSIKADVGFETAKKEMDASLHVMADNDILRSFNTSRNIRISPRYTNITYKHVLLPVWSSVFGYSGKTYRYVVNGANGNVYGQRPISKPKVAAAIVVVLIIVFGIIGFFSGDEESVASIDLKNTVKSQVCIEMSSWQTYDSLIDLKEIK